MAYRRGFGDATLVPITPIPGCGTGPGQSPCATTNPYTTTTGQTILGVLFPHSGESGIAGGFATVAAWAGIGLVAWLLFKKG